MRSRICQPISSISHRRVRPIQNSPAGSVTRTAAAGAGGAWRAPTDVSVSSTATAATATTATVV